MNFDILDEFRKNVQYELLIDLNKYGRQFAARTLLKVVNDSTGSDPPFVVALLTLKITWRRAALVQIANQICHIQNVDQ